MVVSWIGTVAFCSIAIGMKDHGGGLNFRDVPDDEFKIFNKAYQNAQMVGRVSIFFAKLAILLLYIRIFYPKGTYRTTLWWVIQAVIWLNLLYTVGLILTISLQCVPYHLPYGSSCANQYAILLSASTINTLSDILVLVIPMGSLWRLQMSRAKKLSIWALFAFGALAPLFSLTRLLYQVTQASGDNKTVIATTVLLLALGEQVVSIVTGCMPVASVFFMRRVFNKKSGGGGSGKRSSDPNRTITQRFWPNRESGKQSDGWPSSSRRKRKGAASNPYYLSTLRGDDGIVVSEEGLTGAAAVGERDIETPPDYDRSLPPQLPNAIHVVNVISTSSVTRGSRGSSGHKVEVQALRGL